MENIPRHILILSSWYPDKKHPFLGNFVQEQARLLSEYQQVTVLHLQVDQQVNTVIISEKKTGNLLEITAFYPQKTSFISRWYWKRKAFKKLLDYLTAKEIPVSLIHAHVLIPDGLLFVEAKHRFQVPLIVTEHSSVYRPEKFSKLNFKQRLLLKFVGRHIDQLIAVSAFQKKDLQRAFPQQEIKIVPNHVDPQLFYPEHKKEKNEKTRFLHISTLDPATKNPEGILQAASLLLEQGKTSFLLHIVSDEPFQHLQLFCDENGLTGYVQFSGPIEHEKINTYYFNSDAFILFSGYETFSIVLAEALYCGLPVLTTPVGLAAELDEACGYLVKQNDPTDLAEKMALFVENKTTFSPEKIHASAEKYAPEHILNLLETIYQQTRIK